MSLSLDKMVRFPEKHDWVLEISDTSEMLQHRHYKLWTKSCTAEIYPTTMDIGSHHFVKAVRVSQGPSRSAQW